MKFSFFILICLMALLATMLPATAFGKPLLNSAVAGKGFGAFVGASSTAGNADK